MFYNKAKKKAIATLKESEASYVMITESANQSALDLYASRKSAAQAINRIENYVNTLANSPKEFKKEISELQLSLKDFHEAIRIETDNAKNNIKGGVTAISGTLAGGAIAAMGPTAAMAIATAFGTASTGTAISALTGAAATNAALAWLGGGALAAGGGGMAAGQAFLALAGPVGWTIAGVLAVGGGAFAAIKNKKAAKEAHSKNMELQEKIMSLEPLLKEIKSLNASTVELKKGLSITMMVNTYPKDYLLFTDEQKVVLAGVINNARAMGELINRRISQSDPNGVFSDKYYKENFKQA